MSVFVTTFAGSRELRPPSREQVVALVGDLVAQRLVDLETWSVRQGALCNRSDWEGIWHRTEERGPRIGSVYLLPRSRRVRIVPMPPMKVGETRHGPAGAVTLLAAGKGEGGVLAALDRADVAEVDVEVALGYLANRPDLLGENDDAPELTVHAYARPDTVIDQYPDAEDESGSGPDDYLEHQTCWYVELCGNGPEKFPVPLLDVLQRHFGADMIVGANFH